MDGNTTSDGQRPRPSPSSTSATRRDATPAEQAAEAGAGAAPGRALPARVRRPRAVQHRSRAVPHDPGGPDAALRLRAVPPRRADARHRRVGSDRPADDRRARRCCSATPIKVTVGTPSAIQAILKKSESSHARARGGDRELPAAAPARRRRRRRSAHRRQADGRLEPGHPAGRHDDLHAPSSGARATSTSRRRTMRCT